MAINTQSILSTLETKIASMDSNTPLDDMIVNIKSYQEAGGVVSIQYDSSGAMPILDSAQAGLVLYSASDTALYTFNGNTWAAVGNAAAGDAGDGGWVFQGTVSGYTSGGQVGASASNIIDKFSFAADANATDVGDLTVARSGVAGQSSAVSGYTSGDVSSNVIDKFPFAADGNATDVGDLSVARSSGARSF